MPSIDMKRLKQMIQEELSLLGEGEDHDAAAKMAGAASKLLNAVEAFKEVASEKAKTELEEHVLAFEKVLSRIVASPMQYVDASKPVEKRVTLKPQKPKML
jgi:hypothetical protein